MLNRFLLRRLVHTIGLLAAVSILTFLLLDLAPGDFFAEARINPQLSRATLDSLREQYGLNRNLGQKYLYWLESSARGDFGFSFAYNLPVSKLLWPRARRTLQLTLPALALSWLIALPLGVWSAARSGRSADRLVSGAIALLIATPDLALACLALFVAVRAGRLHSDEIWLPLGVLVLGAVPMLVRHVRAALLEAGSQPYARAARANGIAGIQYWWRWLLPAAANPLTSLFGLSVAGLISSSLVVEVVMGWPGLGPLLLESIASRDFYLVIAPVLLSAAFLSLGTLLADVLLYALDPRIRTGA